MGNVLKRVESARMHERAMLARLGRSRRWLTLAAAYRHCAHQTGNIAHQGISWKPSMRQEEPDFLKHKGTDK